jgi:hypothetical protein
MVQLQVQVPLVIPNAAATDGTHTCTLTESLVERVSLLIVGTLVQNLAVVLVWFRCKQANHLNLHR